MDDGRTSAGEFHGKTVIVTGAASGLGRTTALAFARAGADQVIVDVNAEGLEETAAMIVETGAAVEPVAVDLLDTANCPKVVDAAIGRFGRLDALLNIAGLFRFTPLAQLTRDQFDMILGVNLRAPVFLIQAAMPHLIETRGAVVNVASSSAFFGHSYLGPYAASKAALVNLTKSLAVEFSSAPVRINALAPGGVATPMALSAQFPEGMNFDLIARYGGLRGISQPEDMTELLLFLASPRAKAVHGACFVADLGMTAG